MNVSISLSGGYANFPLTALQSVLTAVALSAAWDVRPVVTGVTFDQTTRTGSLMFKEGVVGSVFSLVDNNTYPVALTAWNANLGVTSNPSSSGLQVGTMTVTLSTMALSGRTLSAVSVENPIWALPESVYTVNVPFENSFSQAEHVRRVQGEF